MTRRFNRQQRIALYLASGGVCERCGVELPPGWHADHMQAWSKGGLTDVINGQALCPTCNLKKGAQVENKKPLRKWQQEALERYDQHQGKIFLAEACPGAGKSRLIAEVVQREGHKGKAAAFLIVVPSKELRRQMADDFHAETGIQLDPTWNGDGVPLIHGAFKGAVVTYQWLASSSNAVLLKRYVSRQPTLAVLDEVHHAQEEKVWGEALSLALEPAAKILLTTGTPFTSNGNPIAFVEYDTQTGLAMPDYSYNYGQAHTDGVVRTIVFNRHQGEMEWEDGKEIKKATFADKLSRRDRSRRLNTAIHEDNEHVGSLLREAVNKLRDMRKDDPDAAMLVVAKDQKHASKLAERMEQELGITPIVVISGDGDKAAGRIKAFKAGRELCIIAVDMISEGVNIPRIRVIVYATNVTTFLYFEQVLGRAMRIESDHNDHTAFVFIPDDERFRDFAEKIIRECEEALIAREKNVGDIDKEKTEQETIWFNPLSASFSDVEATINGIRINASELSVVATLQASNPALAGLDRGLVGTVLKATGWNFSPIKQNGPQDYTAPSQPKDDKADYARLEDLKTRNKKLVGALCNRRKLEYQDINIRLNSAVGISSTTKCFYPEILEKRRKLALRWLEDGIEPEVPFNG